MRETFRTARPSCFLSITGAILLLLTANVGKAAQLRPFSHPPASFSAEDTTFPGAVPLTDCVLRALGTDTDVLNVLEYEKNNDDDLSTEERRNLSAERPPQSWFTASRRNLGAVGTYVVVMGAGKMRGANINPFWIFLQHGDSCDLLLSVGAHDLEVLRAATSHIPDVKIFALTAARQFESRYKFDSRKYRLVGTTSQPIGEHVPKDLSRFETRRPLIQGVDQGPEAVLTEARFWLWQQWCQAKESYLEVVLHSKEGDETTTTYFITKQGGQLQMMIQTHHIAMDYSGDGRSLTEDKLEIATSVERRLALANEPDRKTTIPENEEASPDTYELYLRDDSGFNIGVV